MVIQAGDLLVGDEDGLVAFSQADAAEVLRRAEQHAAHEEEVKAEIATGALRQSWMDKVLQQAGLAD
jgi:regulator of RNase E activity RraA